MFNFRRSRKRPKSEMPEFLKVLYYPSTECEDHPNEKTCENKATTVDKAIGLSASAQTNIPHEKLEEQAAWEQRQQDASMASDNLAFTTSS